MNLSEFNKSVSFVGVIDHQNKDVNYVICFYLAMTRYFIHAILSPVNFEAW